MKFFGKYLHTKSVFTFCCEVRAAPKNQKIQLNRTLFTTEPPKVLNKLAVRIWYLRVCVNLKFTGQSQDVNKVNNNVNNVNSQLSSSVNPLASLVSQGKHDNVFVVNEMSLECSSAFVKIMICFACIGRVLLICFGRKLP